MTVLPSAIKLDCMTFSQTVSAALAPRVYTDALRNVPSPVAIVTTEVSGRPWGLTVSAFCSVSADPPTILVAISRNTQTFRVIEESMTFGVSLLADDQFETAERAAQPGMPKFIELENLKGAYCHLECIAIEITAAADHGVVLARVNKVEAAPPGAARPLLYFDRSFHRLGEHIAERRGH